MLKNVLSQLICIKVFFFRRKARQEKTTARAYIPPPSSIAFESAKLLQFFEIAANYFVFSRL